MNGYVLAMKFPPSSECRKSAVVAREVFRHAEARQGIMQPPEVVIIGFGQDGNWHRVNLH